MTDAVKTEIKEVIFIMYGISDVTFPGSNTVCIMVDNLAIYKKASSFII